MKKKSKKKNRLNIISACITVAVLAMVAVLAIVILSPPADKDEKPQNDNVNNESITYMQEAAPSQDESQNEDVSQETTVVYAPEIQLNKTVINTFVGRYEKLTAEVSNAQNKTVIWSSSDSEVAKVSSNGQISALKEGNCKITATLKQDNTVFAEATVTVTPEVIEGATYIEGILIVNKSYKLPESYNIGTNALAKHWLDIMFAAAKQDGINLRVVSGFRSYSTQKTLYGNYVNRDGQAAADRYSARAGHSEHQTGLAFDLNSTADAFADTKEAKWIKENAHKYGFIVRYPNSKEEYTGYMYEPWHVRYIGADMAQRVYDSGLCLEEYLGIESVYEDTI